MHILHLSLLVRSGGDGGAGIIAWIVIGGVAGWLGAQVVKGTGLGVVANIVVGILGAVLGGWLLGLLGFNSDGGLIPTLLTATLGAVVLLVLLGVSRRR